MADAIFGLDALFRPGAPNFFSPAGELGIDPTVDELGCAAYSAVEEYGHVWRIAKTPQELEELMAKIVNADADVGSAADLRVLRRELMERSDPWVASLELAPLRVVPSAASYPLRFRSSEAVPAEDEVVFSVCISDEHCATCIELNNPAPGQGQLAAADGGGSPGTPPVSTATGCCDIACAPVTVVGSPPPGRTCLMTTEAACGCTDSTSALCKQTFAATNRCIATTWHRYGTCETRDDGSKFCKDPSTGADPPEYSGIRGICGALSIAHSSVNRFSTPATMPLDDAGNLDPDFVALIFMLGGGRTKGYSITEEEMIRAHERIAESYGSAVRCSIQTAGSAASVREWCEGIAASIADQHDKILVVRGPNGAHAMYVKGAVFADDRCYFTTEDTSKQGSGLQGIPADPPDQVWTVDAKQQVDLYSGENQAGWRAMQYRSALVINCELVD